MKSSRNHVRIAMLAGAALVLLPVLALAQPGGPRHFGRHGVGPQGPGFGGPGGGFLAGRLFERLDLSDEQLDAVHAAFEAALDEGIALHRSAWEQRRALAAAADADVVDEGAIREAAAALGQIEADLALHRARQMQRVREILTPEQREEMRELRDRVAERRQGMRERFHHGWHHPE